MPTPEALVAIGHFGMPGTVELQARLVRKHCGPAVPVLVSDDWTQQAFDPGRGEGPGHGRARKARLLRACRAHGLLYRRTAAARCRHCGGDLGAFYHGLRAALRRGIPYVAKVSMRLLIDRPGWLAETVAALKASGRPTASYQCLYAGRTAFGCRTEFVLMEAAAWGRPDVLELLRPRPLGGVPVEHLVERVFNRIGGGMLGPAWLGPDRNVAYPGVVWHDSHPRAAYEALAAREGVDLGPEFHAGCATESRGYAGC